MTYGEGDCTCEPAVGKGAYRVEAGIRRSCPIHGERDHYRLCITCGDRIEKGTRCQRCWDGIEQDRLERESNR